MGIEGAIPLLHGSQGCATYIRRYMISHFKEPVDIASSNFSESTAIFGGGANLKRAVANIQQQYHPRIIGIATTCLSETIGDDVPMIVKSIENDLSKEEGPMNATKTAPHGLRPHKKETPLNIVHVSTPSYRGTHSDGFLTAMRAIVEQFSPPKGAAVSPSPDSGSLNIFPGMLSPADIRYLKEIFTTFKIPFTILPDYSERLDGPLWEEYRPIAEGGTPIQNLKELSIAKATLEFGRVLAKQPETAGKLLNERFSIPCNSIGIPIGVRETDRFLNTLKTLSKNPIPNVYKEERNRLVDAYIDGHKYVSQNRALIYGEEDFVVGLFFFLREIGILPVLCASGGKSGVLQKVLAREMRDIPGDTIRIREGVDFVEIEEEARHLDLDIIIGNSKGYAMARRLNVPLVRVGFPIHDRIGGSRILHVGYRGAQELFDRITNTILASRQERSKVGYSYM